ncbi:30S ribosomal protein S16 [Candidatus Peregrinibacteria bacterium RIFOXYC2_FULL_33_13]|nr:MAG: 30S ribosomal protein S16 [Candidatus Peregrinibacteria bacterium GW2011_GWA2_33_10]KKP40992.1 MAG: 30S ribosomal protein S16, small subunit ribosomal protein S16 [Candidatus Peregrinibacteria bacterium GW2011_GWC2_33_13]OGJ50300.1 MAG: 30S ribosomal protein S16 [Candidatus Peregrinibacteria bacterium RIFOXYA2_FULL_33_7]OGJ52675.1 MAG: 30S ribosomal protein S16 [Candidatus Peregrinibacteria bacterium RIFOXYC2_FULL_33_13]
MLVIRLSRTGRRNQPKYRIVVAEKDAPIKGKFIEVVGHYIPISSPKVFEAKKERIEYWISVGAKPSDTVAVLLKNHMQYPGIEAYIQPRSKQRKSKKAQAAEAKAQAA